jgi:hypothetical protein
MFKLYIGNRNYSSWSLRGWLIAKLSGEPFEEVDVPLTGLAPNPANLAFSPSGLVPCLHEGDIVVWDSMAIAGHLAERHPDMWPADLACTRLGAGDQRRDARGFRCDAQPNGDVHPRARRRAPVVEGARCRHRACGAHLGRIAPPLWRRWRVPVRPFFDRRLLLRAVAFRFRRTA